MDGLRALGDDVWFNLGDRDLADRASTARAGSPRASALTEALAALTRVARARARVLPMSDEPVRTFVTTDGADLAVPGVHDPRRRQGRATAEIRDVEFRGAGRGGR